MPIKSKIRTVPNYPKKGVMFRDITTLIKDPVGFRLVIDTLTQRYLHADFDFDTIVGIESRGFIIGAAMSYALGKGFIPIRKKGKLPAEVVSQEYTLEYGTDRIEIHRDALRKGERGLLVDDLLATGGTAMAPPAGGEKPGCGGVTLALHGDRPTTGGGKKLREKGCKVFTLTEFE